MFRVRHCVQCPGCQTWYLIGFSPYGNGAYLVCAGNGAEQEYMLYCFCGTDLRRRWRWREVKACEITTAVHERGYGSAEEVFLISP